MSKKLRYGLMIFSASIVAVLIIAVLAYRGAELKYVFNDWASKIGGSTELKETEIKTENASLEDLLADIRTTLDDSLMLINTEHMIDDGYTFEVVEYKDSGIYMNSCMTGAYAKISDEINNRFGEKLYISSAYRTADEQRKQVEEEGASAQAVGASEHQAGLAVDVYVLYYGGIGFIKHEVGQWVNSNCQDYGFIIRYPYYGERETGIGYEPWHLRYVGFPHAEIISKSLLTLESYLDLLKNNIFYSYESGEKSWLIVRQLGEMFKIPKDYESVVISPDNCGGYVLTFEQ